MQCGRSLRDCVDDFTRVRHYWTTRRHWVAESRLKGNRCSGNQYDLHVFPVFTRLILNNPPSLQHRLTLFADHQSVGRPPQRGFCEIPDSQFMSFAVEFESHSAQLSRIALLTIPRIERSLQFWINGLLVLVHLHRKRGGTN